MSNGYNGGNRNGYSGNRGGGSGGNYRGGGGGYQGRGQGQGQGQRKDMSGSIRRNFDKQTDKQPDKKGSAMIAGRLYFVSVWDNGDYEKISFTAADDAQNSRSQQQSNRGPQQGGDQGMYGNAPDLNDEVPF